MSYANANDNKSLSAESKKIDNDKKNLNKHKSDKENKNNLEEDEYFKIYEEEEEVHKKFHITKRRRGIILAVISFVVFMSACFWYLDFRGRLDQFETALYNGQYVEAQNIYNNFTPREKKEANTMVEEKIVQIDKSYYDNVKYSVDFSLREYRNLSVVDFPKSDTKFYDMIEKFENLKDSNEKYNEAEEAFKKQDYELAIKKYNDVSNQDRNYNLSQEKLKKAVDEYEKEKFKKTDELVSVQKYDEAISIIDQCLKLIPNEEELVKKRKEYLDKKLEAKIDDIKNDAWSYVKNEKYTEAIWVLKNAQREYNSPKEIMDKIEEYKDLILKKMDGYVEKKDYNAAVALANDYLKADPNDKDMQERLKEYKPSMLNAEALVDMKKTNESGSYYIVDRNIEVFGYKNMSKSGQFSVATNKATKISGLLSYSDNKNVKGGKGKLTIIAGDEQKTYELSKKDRVTKIDIDLVNCQNVIFKWNIASEKNDNSYGLVLENVNFYK